MPMKTECKVICTPCETGDVIGECSIGSDNKIQYQPLQLCSQEFGPSLPLAESCDTKDGVEERRQPESNCIVQALQMTYRDHVAVHIFTTVTLTAQKYILSHVYTYL